MKNLFIFIIILFFASCKNADKADTIIHHAVIYTVDAAFTIAEAMAMKDGKIIAVGTNDFILKKYAAKEMIDAAGKPVYPGFIDAHAHFLAYGKGLFEVQLYNCETWEDVLHHISDFIKNNDSTQWIIGRGWDQNKFSGKQFPTNELLNKLYPNTPVLLTRVDGHAAIANAKALSLAGIQINQKLVGGSIETNNGKLTGLLIDNAVDLVSSKILLPIYRMNSQNM
jgi:predicted amidohydrolase YtcJ